MSQKKCVIFYKKAWLDTGTCYGERFDSLDKCCLEFHTKFYGTGNQKSNDWNAPGPYDVNKEGLNLVIQGGKMNLLLWGFAIRFCPWCGANIEIQKSKDVTIRMKTKVIPEGYEELARNST